MPNVFTQIELININKKYFNIPKFSSKSCLKNSLKSTKFLKNVLIKSGKACFEFIN